MNLFALTAFTTGILSLILGLFVVLRTRSRMNRLWSGVSFSVGFWSVGLGGVTGFAHEQLAYYSQAVLDIAGIFIPVFFLHFVLALIQTPQERIRRVRIVYLAAGVLAAVSLTPWFKKGLRPLFDFNYWVDPGPLYVVFPVFFLVIVVLASVLLIRSIPLAIGVRKEQMKYILYTALFGFGGGVFNFLPQFSQVYPIGNFLVFMYITMVTFAIVRSRFMNIRFVVSRMMQYAFSFASSLVIVQATLYSFGAFGRDITHVRAWLVGALLAFFVILLHDPFERFFEKVTDRIFFRGQPDYQKLLETVGHSIAKEVSQEGLIRSVSTLLRDRLKVEHAKFWVLSERSGIFEVRVGTGQEPPIPPDSPLVALLQQSNAMLVTEEVEIMQNEALTREEYLRLSALVDELHRLDISLARRVMVEGKLVAIMVLGPKLSKDIFDRQVIEVLDVLAPQIATALGRTKLYDEAQQFAATLKSEVERATAELAAANKHLKELDQSKSEFLSIAAHQLRTPLTGIKGYVSMFLEGDFGVLTPEQRGQLESIFRSADRLTRLIDVFLNVSRIETGRLDLKREPLKLEEIIDEVVGDVSQQAKEKNLELTVQKPDEPLPTMSLDRDKIHDVMMNLVDNAVKYTEKGWVNVRLARSKSLVTFEVRDSGMGIAADEIDRLFQKFTRAEAVTRIHTGGSGLGLFIAKKIIEAHAGRIWAESEGEGKGSMFTFTLPIDSKAQG